MLRSFLPFDTHGFEAYFISALLVFTFAFLVTLLSGAKFIPWLRRQRIQDGEARKASETLNQINQGKAETPTMGGIFILSSIVISALLLVPFNRVTISILLAITGSGLLGVYDDWSKLKRKGRDGISAKTKMLLQLSLFTLCTFILFGSEHVLSRGLWIPFVNIELSLGYLFLPFALVVLSGTSNAVNLSDGLDGLASGMGFMVALCFGVIVGLGLFFEAGRGVDSWFPMVSEITSIGFIAFIVAGSCLGFLVYNRHPAKVFMGDTGSLALGAALAMIALALHQELLLALAGGVFVAEALSVILQVGFFKLSGGKRLFKCSPLHHHFQFLGWQERRVTRSFWLASGLCCVLALGVFVFSFPQEKVDSEFPKNSFVNVSDKEHGPEKSLETNQSKEVIIR